MAGQLKSLIWGIILIAIGFILLGNNLEWFYLDWEAVWPLFMIFGGVLFWGGWAARRSEYGLLMPGTILIVYGILFEYCALEGWYWMEYYWPVFLLGPGLGFLAMFAFGTREKGLLIPASVLLALTILFWSGFDFFRYFWPSLLILIGIVMLLNVFRSKNKKAIVDSDAEDDSD